MAPITPGKGGRYSFTMTMIAEMITQMMITICMAIQKRGSSCTPLMVAGTEALQRGAYSMMAWRRAIATACVRVSA